MQQYEVWIHHTTPHLPCLWPYHKSRCKCTTLHYCILTSPSHTLPHFTKMHPFLNTMFDNTKRETFMVTIFTIGQTRQFCSLPFRRLCTVDTGSTAPPTGNYTEAETALYGSYVHKASPKSLRGFTIISLIIIAQELRFILPIHTSPQFSSAFKMGPTLRFSRSLFNRMLKTRV